ncbi:flagellar motor switch protein FliN [Candidatus Paracaedibacter acanthamoebae]|uniref:Flagellar motor switch protein FliN n=2 Tax=Candidatus Odyssella acanthamoebae TaxID=91604 RepID=A0A077B0S5_9PROT|nr:flagellar motor switch protein FliN [Candidatus Paracaedibacter acanthamoebae]AIK96525.1 flagellar motor switch protein FliN [Candidatus Paracaedibacter acanthamoebae]
MSEEENKNPTMASDENSLAGTGQPASSSFNELEQGGGDTTTLGDVNDFSAVYNVPVQISAVLGRAVMPVSQLLKLGRGAVVELDRRVGESVDIYVNNRLVARGEVVIVDERLGITMTEIIKSER